MEPHRPKSVWPWPDCVEWGFYGFYGVHKEIGSRVHVVGHEAWLRVPAPVRRCREACNRFYLTPETERARHCPEDRCLTACPRAHVVAVACTNHRYMEGACQPQPVLDSKLLHQSQPCRSAPWHLGLESWKQPAIRFHGHGIYEDQDPLQLQMALRVRQRPFLAGAGATSA